MRIRARRLSSSWGWLLALFSVAGFIETVFWGQIGAFTPLYLPRLGVAPRDVPIWIGAIAVVSNLVGLPFLPFWGALADRYARQPVIVRSFVVHTIAGVLAVLAGNVWVFLLARSVMSFALGMSGLMMAALAERTPAGRQGFAFSVMNTTPPLGAFVGPLVGGPIVDTYGFRVLLLIDTALMMAVVLALTFGYRDAFRGQQTAPLLSMAVDSVRIILHSPRLRALLPALFMLFAGWMLAVTYVPLTIAALYTGASLGTVVGIVLGVGGLTTLFVGPAMGAIADRFGHWRTLFVGAAVAVVLWPLPALAHNLVSFAITWALLNGAASGVFALSFSVLAGSIAADVRGRVMSFAYLPVKIGFILGPAIGSVVTRVNVFAIFPLAAAFTLLGVGVLALAARQPVTAPAVRVA
ncbi:MAG TPA: MFS transporter [Ktedonobacterales bacterium]|nr:MFS transporter [Ktedonobacterales bacterium]